MRIQIIFQNWKEVTTEVLKHTKRTHTKQKPTKEKTKRGIKQRKQTKKTYITQLSFKKEIKSGEVIIT